MKLFETLEVINSEEEYLLYLVTNGSLVPRAVAIQSGNFRVRASVSVKKA